MVKVGKTTDGKIEDITIDKPSEDGITNQQLNNDNTI